MRREIVERLSNGALPVGELAASLPIGRPAVSKHLRVLTDAGLVSHTSRGTRNLYALAPHGQVQLQQWLVTMWDGALHSYADYLEREKL
jgi:DNA-binding transcriptional ArsR family regulator